MKNNQGRTRVLNIEKELLGLVNISEIFRVGVYFDQNLIDRVDLAKYGINNTFTEGLSQVPKPVKATTKANIKGKYVRKQPEEKTEIERHISYTRRKDGARVEYDRVYNIYTKVLLHQFNAPISFERDDNGNELLLSPHMTFDRTQQGNEKCKHIINVFLEVFQDYDLFREDLNPFFKFEKNFDEEILPSGTLSEARTASDLIGLVERHAGPEEAQFFADRLDVFKEFQAIVKAGSKGINGYMTFEFDGKDIIVAESIRRNNATYVFNKQGYQEEIMRDKQDVRKNGLAIKIFNHLDNWERNIRAFLNQH